MFIRVVRVSVFSGPSVLSKIASERSKYESACSSALRPLRESEAMQHDTRLHAVRSKRRFSNPKRLQEVRLRLSELSHSDVSPAYRFETRRDRDVIGAHDPPPDRECLFQQRQSCFAAL